MTAAPESFGIGSCWLGEPGGGGGHIFVGAPLDGQHGGGGGVSFCSSLASSVHNQDGGCSTNRGGFSTIVLSVVREAAGGRSVGTCMCAVTNDTIFRENCVYVSTTGNDCLALNMTCSSARGLWTGKLPVRGLVTRTFPHSCILAGWPSPPPSLLFCSLCSPFSCWVYDPFGSLHGVATRAPESSSDSASFVLSATYSSTLPFFCLFSSPGPSAATDAFNPARTRNASFWTLPPSTPHPCIAWFLDLSNSSTHKRGPSRHIFQPIILPPNLPHIPRVTPFLRHCLHELADQSL